MHLDSLSPAFSLPVKKRLFDLTLCLVSGIIWIPVFVVATLLLWLCEGKPVFYVSNRRVSGDKSIKLWKYRTMVRNAAELIEQDRSGTTNSERFLNVNPDSPLYTRLGRIFESIQLTELPQIFHVLQGKMSIVGARPLPEAVIGALKEAYPDVEKRFLIPGGLTGPVQLIGRDYIGDSQRLRLEIAYCEACVNQYSIMLDLHILLRTIMMVLRIRTPLTIAQTYDLIQKYAGSGIEPYTDTQVASEERV